MRYLLIILLITACNPKTGNQVKADILSPDQNKLQLLVGHYQVRYSQLPNDMAKDAYRKSYLDTIHFFLKDSLKYIMQNFRLTVNEIATTDIGNIKAFHAKFEDQNGNEYWTEWDYKIGKEKELYKNPVYILLKDMPEKIDTTLSMFYFGSVEWKDYLGYDSRLKIEVIPLSNKINIDSIRNAKKKVK